MENKKFIEMNTPTRNHMNGGSAKLSLMARYDDLCRHNNSLILKEIDEVESIISLIKNFEETRIKWTKALEEIRERNSFILKLETEIRDLKEQLQSIRMAFAREVKTRSLLKNENDYLKKRHQLLKKFIMNDMPNLTTMQSNTELMSVLNMEKPPKDDTDDGLLFDKSDDSIDGDVREVKIARYETPKKEKINISDDENSVFNTGFVSDKQIDDQIKSIPSTNFIECRKSTQIYSRKNLLSSKLEPDRLDSRPHKLQEKTCLKPLICTVCGKNISFCSQYVVCTECRGVGHNRCKNLLPKPCLPYISSQSIRKMISMGNTKNGLGKLLMISDFTNGNTRPCVPALLIHCCNEIDRRICLAKKDLNRQNNNGTDSSLVGLYRVCANSGDIRELRNKILEAKHGIPNLTTIIDIHTICGVVKMFLIDLQDALLTRVLWHDFVRASEHVLETKPKQIHDSDSEKRDSGLDEDDKYSSDNDDDTDEMKVLKGVIINMPIVNRDSLAFLMLHLNNVAKAESITKMNIASLANIFAPTIVGNSEFRQLSSRSLMKEHPKQLIVIQALFLIQDHFWNGLLKDQNFDPFKDNPPQEMKIDYYNRKCSKLAKISSSNLKILLNEHDKNLKNNQNAIGSAKPLTSIVQSKCNKRGSIQSMMESLY